MKEDNNSQEKKRNDYHGAFEAALKSKYDDEHESMETHSEMPLGEEAPILDLLILKKDPGLKLTDEIGCFFKENNVIENKGYGDGISINDVFKVQAYAGMYMVIDKKVDEIPWETMTVTVIQLQRPLAALKRLKEMGCEIKERVEKTIWEVSGPPVMFPFQIVNAIQLSEEWAVIKALVPGASEETLLKLLDEYEQTKDPRKKEHLSVVMKLSLVNNSKTVLKMKETGIMNDEFMETARLLFPEEFEAQEKKFEAEKQRIKTELEAEKKRSEANAQKASELEASSEQAIQNMLQDNVKASTIMKWTGATLDRIGEIATKLGITTLQL